ncbi:MAG: hypothetical protein ACRD23_05700 [Terriglobales bacterium]
MAIDLKMVQALRQEISDLFKAEQAQRVYGSNAHRTDGMTMQIALLALSKSSKH